ncbi:MAG: hypothetical protein C4344_01455 [Acidimicrobiia bacterium]
MIRKVRCAAEGDGALSSSGLADIWAKSAVREGAPGEALTAHTEAVLGCLEVLRRRLGTAPERLGAPRFWIWAEAALRCHDLGKAAEGFQRQLRGGPSWSRRHEVLSLAFVPGLVDDDSDALWVAAAVVTHHRDIEEILRSYDPDLSGELFAEMAAEIEPHVRDELWAWLGRCPAPVDPDVIATCLRDVRRHVDRIRLDPDLRLVANLLRGVVLSADHAGSAHVRLRERSSLFERELIPSRPYGHQIAAASTDGNVVVVAPTGSGKTEAALGWAAHQSSRPGAGAPRLFYVLPYQASINAMHRRLVELAAGPGAPPDTSEVALVHAKATQVLYRSVLADSQMPATAAVRARRQRALARLAVPAVRVTTPYQLLRGLFGGRGAEPVLADTAGSLFVLDELHAYEPLRTGLILGALELWTRRLDGLACVLSATLPTRLVDLVEEAIGSATLVRADRDTFAAFRRHRLDLRDAVLDRDAALAECCAAVAGGRSVLVVANTVARAIELGEALRGHLGVPIEILHGRFAARDRVAKERRLLEARGPGAEEPVVCVATQVVEVSLDVDFDHGVFELAPLDALIQRMGRVNRRRRHRVADVVVFGGARRDPAPYGPGALEAAWAVLGDHDGDQLDESGLQSWVDEALDRSGGDAWTAQVRDAWVRFRTSFIEAVPVFSSDDSHSKRFEELFDGVEVLPSCLREEYERLRSSGSELAATELLVPVSRRRLLQLRRRGRAQWDAGIGQWVLDAPYDTDLGLRLE